MRVSKRKMSNNDAGANAAKELISMVIADVRKGSPRTGTINSRNSQNKKRASANLPNASIVIPTPEEATEQLRKFENMIIIQRLDSLLDMQKMQWEKLDRISGLLESLNLVVSDQQSMDDEPQSSTASLEEFEEMIKAQETAKTPVDDTYEQAERRARKIAKVKNDIN